MTHRPIVYSGWKEIASLSPHVYDVRVRRSEDGQRVSDGGRRTQDRRLRHLAHSDGHRRPGEHCDRHAVLPQSGDLPATTVRTSIGAELSFFFLAQRTNSLSPLPFPVWASGAQVCTQKCHFSLGDPSPTLHMAPLARTSPRLKRHLGRLSRFCNGHTDRPRTQTDTQTVPSSLSPHLGH